MHNFSEIDLSDSILFHRVVATDFGTKKHVVAIRISSRVLLFVSAPAFLFSNAIPPPPPSKLAVVVFCSYSCSCGPFLHKCEHRNRCANVMYGRFSLLLVRVFSTVVRTVILVKKKKLAATLEQTLSNRFTKFVHSVVNSLWDELYSILNWLDIRTRKIK